MRKFKCGVCVENLTGNDERKRWSDMKARLKFSKVGSMRFIGHLDVMRYFQKAFRRAEIGGESYK